MAKSKSKPNQGGTVINFPLPPPPPRPAGPTIVVPKGSGLDQDPLVKHLIGGPNATIIVDKKNLYHKKDK